MEVKYSFDLHLHWSRKLYGYKNQRALLCELQIENQWALLHESQGTQTGFLA